MEGTLRLYLQILILQGAMYRERAVISGSSEFYDFVEQSS